MIETWRNGRKPTLIAWGVHLFTASGALWGTLALIAVMQSAWQLTFFWLALAVIVDSVDGYLARRFHVKELTPDFDGALLDNVIDYLTYVVVPALLLYQADLLPTAVSTLGVALVVLSSAFQFSQADAKTADHSFKGFPSYWNVVVFYLFMLPTHPWLNFAIIFLCAVLVFVPVHYLYPSRMTRYRQPTILLAVLWGVLILWPLAQYPHHPIRPLWISLLFILYYVGLSLALMKKPWRDA